MEIVNLDFNEKSIETYSNYYNFNAFNEIKCSCLTIIIIIVKNYISNKLNGALVSIFINIF